MNRKIIIDTNIVLSGIWKDRNPEAIMQFVLTHPNFQWIASEEIILEYKAVLARKKFNLDATILSKWFLVFDKFITLVSVLEDFQYPRDQKDAKFLSCAVASQADFFITGDSDFDEAHKLVSTRIVSATTFVRYFL